MGGEACVIEDRLIDAWQRMAQQIGGELKEVNRESNELVHRAPLVSTQHKRYI